MDLQVAKLELASKHDEGFDQRHSLKERVNIFISNGCLTSTWIVKAVLSFVFIVSCDVSGVAVDWINVTENSEEAQRESKEKDRIQRNRLHEC